MKFSTASAILALTATSALAAPADDVKLEKRTFGIFTARCDTGTANVQINQAVTNGLFGLLNLKLTLLGLATQCNNQILANQAKYAGGSTTSSSTSTDSSSGTSSADTPVSTDGSSSDQSTDQSSTTDTSSSGSSGSSGSTSGSTSGSAYQGATQQSSQSGSRYTGIGTKVTYGSNSQAPSGGYTFQTQRQQFTQNLVAHMKQQYPNYAVVACIPGSYNFQGTPVQKSTVQCSTTAGNVNYDVIVYNKGTFNLRGQGGFQNWAYVPNQSCRYSSNQVAC